MHQLLRASAVRVTLGRLGARIWVVVPYGARYPRCRSVVRTPAVGVLMTLVTIFGFGGGGGGRGIACHGNYLYLYDV